LSARHIEAPLHAAEVLLHLPAGEYRLALARMADYMRQCLVDPDLDEQEVAAARHALHEIESRLN
jgi:hypothetical protein